MKNEANQNHYSRTDFPKVNSLDNLEVGRIYTTDNYPILKHLENNRGEVKGYQSKRVKPLLNKIDKGLFFMDVFHVIVNLDGYIIDGNNRLEALKQRGLPVNFFITGQNAFNGKSASEILNNVSEFNSLNSEWAWKDCYQSALALDEPVAMVIEQVRNSLTLQGMNLNTFTATRLIGIAQADKGKVSSEKKITRKIFCDGELAEKFKTDAFKKDLDFIVRVMKYVKGNSLIKDAWHVVKSIMPYMWECKLDHDHVFKSIEAVGFNSLTGTELSVVQARVRKIIKHATKLNK